MGFSLSRKTLAGSGYIILNVLRAMNIIGLLAVSTGAVVMLVKTFIVSKVLFPPFLSTSIKKTVDSQLL